MNPDRKQSCLQFEERLFDRASHAADGGAGPDDALSIHLEACGSCRERLARIERRIEGLIEALRSLPRLSAPARTQELVELALGLSGTASRAAGAMGLLERTEVPLELDGRVVAALQAGFRQDRAALGVRRVGRLEPPPALEEQALKAQARVEAAAPAPVLAAEPSGSLAGSLPEPSADDLTRQTMHVSEGTPTIRDRRDWHPSIWRRLGRQRAMLGGLAAAALLLVWAGLAGTLGEGIFEGDTRGARGRYSFEVVEVSSFQDLSPMGRGLLDGAVAGSLSGWERSR